MSVAEHGGGAIRAARGAHLADHERVAVPIEQFALPAGSADHLREPATGRHHLTGMFRVGADRRDPQELSKLVEPFVHSSRAY